VPARIRVTVVQRPQHGNAGHHNNAALLGGTDRAFDSNLPTLALRLGGNARTSTPASRRLHRSPPSPVGIGLSNWRDQPFCIPLAPHKMLIRIQKKVPRQLVADG
jgi:hypothetical protein